MRTKNVKIYLMISDMEQAYERAWIRRQVDPDKEKDLIDILAIRDPMLDQTIMIPETGKVLPDIVIAVCHATQSALRYSNDGTLVYEEGIKHAKADDHWSIFLEHTFPEPKEPDDPQEHESA